MRYQWQREDWQNKQEIAFVVYTTTQNNKLFKCIIIQYYNPVPTMALNNILKNTLELGPDMGLKPLWHASYVHCSSSFEASTFNSVL